MTSQDIMAIVAEIKSHGECRINNIFDVDSKFISLKIKTQDKKNKFLMLDSGKKLYLTETKIENNRKMPSGFVMKMRKHLDNKLILDIKQINYDRVVDISIGYTEVQYHLIVEFYASGNLIFTDENYKIMALSHIHIYEKGENKEDNLVVKVGEIYPIEKSVVSIESYDISKEIFINWLNTTDTNGEDKTKFSYKKLLVQSPLVVFGKDCIEHSLIQLEIEPKDTFDIFSISEIINKIKQNHIINTLTKGYIIYENEKPDNFIPILYEQYKNKKYREYTSFSDCIENYFKQLVEKPQQQLQKKQKKEKEQNKEEQKKNNIENQIKKMEKKIEDVQLKINILEENREIFKLLLDSLNNYNSSNSLIGQVNFIKHINAGLEERYFEYKVDIIYENTNKVEIKNKKFQITHLQSKNTYTCEPNKKPYDIISDLYSEIKKIKSKITTTEDLLNKTIKQIKKEEKIKDNPKNEATNAVAEIEKEESQQKNITIKRKELWFEQYNWFISSEGYLVVSGKTAEQNETLVKKYMDKNDIYMHSDTFGSGSMIIKKIDEKIPHVTIEEASVFLICHTKCWNQNSPDRTFWVYSNQVSKTPESGEYLTKGSFIIRGDRNYLSPPKLELGLSIVYKEKDCDIPKNTLTEKTLFAIPMLAPYKTVNKNKLKVKIIPGNGKINKTIKNNIMDVFKKNMNSKEALFIKEITIEDYQKVMISNIKIL
jgi:predicted ribosome quality control (RQC) complex YloA/Tae2 family protein